MGSKASKLLEESQKSHSKEVNLKEFSLKQIPIVLCTNFSFIVKLNLNDNLIKEIPPDIYKLRALRILWINNNKITNIPDEVGLLSELEDFQVDGNNITRVGKVFFELKKITDLSLSRNHLKEIPQEMSDFKTLKNLQLEHNDLTALPGCISQMTSLKTLNVGQNQIEYIFNDFSLAPALTALTLFANRLSILPDSFGRLSTLSNLNLRSNHLTTLPDSFGQLRSLTTLSLWDNGFTDFPIPLCNCISLTELSFSNNSLSIVPKEIKNLLNLRKFYLQYNQIEQLPMEMCYLVNLNHLLLHHNRLTSIPCEISVLSRTLDSINLSGNPLPPKILQADQQQLMRILSTELTIRRDVCARVIQRHYRVWKKQFRFRNVVFTIIEHSKMQKNIIIANQTAKVIQSAIKIQRWYKSRRILNIWYELVSKVLLLLINNQLSRSNSNNLVRSNSNNLVKSNSNNNVLVYNNNNSNSNSPNKNNSPNNGYQERRHSQRMFIKEHKDLKELGDLSSSNGIDTNNTVDDSDEEERKIKEIKELKELKEINFLGELDDSSSIISGSGIGVPTKIPSIDYKLEKQKSLKKLKIIGGRLGSLYGFEEPDIQDINIIYQDGIIKAATVPKLIEHLCNIDYTEEGFSRYFFATYQSFIKPIELFQLLCVRYHIEPPIHASALELAQFKKTIKPRIQERVIDLMGYWVQNHLNDFQEDTRLLRNFNQFITNTLMFEKETSAKRLIAIFNETKKKHIDNLQELIKLSQNAPKPILPLKTQDGSEFNLLDISSIEIARQMALIDQTLLSKISSTELLSKKWSKCTEETQKICPNILTMIGIFNQCSKWVSSEIVGEKSSKLRIKKLKYFIKIAQHCYDMQNFNGLMLIISGLSCSSVTRLRGTWGALSSHRRDRFDQLEKFVNMEGNFKQYRMLLSEIQNTPCIPFVGLYLMDLTFIDEGNPSYLNGDILVNFVKKRLEANLILRFVSFKLVPYCFEPVSFIQNMLLDSTPMSEKELYDKSIAIEKRHIRKITKKENRDKNKLTTSSVGDLTTLVNPYSSSNSNSNSKLSGNSKISDVISNSSAGNARQLSNSHDPTIELNERKLKRNDTLNSSSPSFLTTQSHSSPTLSTKNIHTKPDSGSTSPIVSPRPKIPLLDFSVSMSLSRNTSPVGSPTTSPRQNLFNPNINKLNITSNNGSMSDRTYQTNHSISSTSIINTTTNNKYEIGGQLKMSASNPYISNLAANNKSLTSTTNTTPSSSKKSSAQNTMSASSSFSSNPSSRDSSTRNSPRANPPPSSYFCDVPIQPTF